MEEKAGHGEAGLAQAGNVSASGQGLLSWVGMLQAGDTLMAEEKGNEAR